MKPILEDLSQDLIQKSFVRFNNKVSHFDFVWHYHPEFELTYIVKGHGKRLVGDRYETFKAGDLVLLGPNLPHTWSSEKYETETCESIVIQFGEPFLKPVLEWPELERVSKMLKKAESGLWFPEEVSIPMMEKLKEILVLPDLVAVLSLLAILQKLTESESFPLASEVYKPVKGKENQSRISTVFMYIQSNFKEEVSIQKAANQIYLSESAFCKFFKRVSGKTFSDYVNEVRISHACQLLIETDWPISQVASDSGFESMTYFNRVFIRKKGHAPGVFRKMKRTL